MNRSRGIGLVRTIRAGVIMGDIHGVFMSRLMSLGRDVKAVVIVSPWLSTFEDQPYSLASFAAHITRSGIPGYVFTRPPETREHIKATNLLRNCPSIELTYNPNLHAKIYACLGREPSEFAILGSANMTMSSSTLYEVGLIVLGVGGGDQVVKSLAGFGMDFLRTRPESVVAKRRGRIHDGA
jgi:hypothetical protein